MFKPILCAALTLTLLSACSDDNQSNPADPAADSSGELTSGNSLGLISFQSDFSASETANRLVDLIDQKGLLLVTRVDHQQNAIDAGLTLNPTEVILFGNPALGTPIMQCAQAAAIDLPQKMLVTEDDQGRVWLSYNDPSYLRDRHSIIGCDQELATISAALEGLALESTSAADQQSAA